MKYASCLGAVLLGLPACAMAQIPAANPMAHVPTVPYRSVFTDTPRGVETDNVDWKAANAEVGTNRRGHIDILNWEAAQQPSPANPQAPAEIAPAPLAPRP